MFLLGTIAGGRFGHAVAKAKDLNGDSFDGVYIVANVYFCLYVCMILATIVLTKINLTFLSHFYHTSIVPLLYFFHTSIVLLSHFQLPPQTRSGWILC